MKLQAVVPMIWTNEIEETIDFYTTVLGFTCGEFNKDWDWATVHFDECEFMIAKPNDYTPFEKPSFTGSFYIKTDDVESWWNKLKNKVNLCYELETFQWNMKEFGFYDNNGYLIQIGQDIINE